MPETPAPRARQLPTNPGAITRWTVNVGPRTAEALNYVAGTFGVSNTEALRRLAEAGYAALCRAAPQPAVSEPPLEDGNPIDWDAGVETEPRIGGLATVDVSEWPAGQAHVWLRVESYAHQNAYADVVLHPGEAHAIAAALGGAAGEVSRRQARDGEIPAGVAEGAPVRPGQPAAAAGFDQSDAAASALLTTAPEPDPAPDGDPL